MSKINLTVNAEKKDIKDSIVNAVSSLDLIITNADTLTLAQARDAIQKLAQHQKKIIKRLVQLK